MKTVEVGKPPAVWSKNYRCTGVGNGGGGCEAMLAVEQTDLFRTLDFYASEPVDHITFACQECGVCTDVTDAPPNVQSGVPLTTKWFPKKRSRG